jgi:hypothetical protein
MKANELRIGNWVADRGGKMFQIDHWEYKDKVSAKEPEMNTCGMLLRGHPITEWVEHLQPIPLTEEWLVKFGFISNPYFDRYEMGVLHIECDKTKGHLMLWIEKLPYAMELKSVHQLQNLFFALTGEELEVKG